MTEVVLTLFKELAVFCPCPADNISNCLDLNSCYRQHIAQTIKLGREVKMAENHLIVLLCKIGILSSYLSYRNIKCFFLVKYFEFFRERSSGDTKKLLFFNILVRYSIKLYLHMWILSDFKALLSWFWSIPLKRIFMFMVVCEDQNQQNQITNMIALLLQLTNGNR